MKLHVFVATTQGLVAIQKIYAQDADIQSVVSVRGTPTVSPITSAYHNFVRKGAGIIEADFGDSSYRVNVSASIDQGNSWQLGFYLAHAAHYRELLGDGSPKAGDKVLIATGELNTSERLVLPVQQVPLKVAKAADTIAAWQSNIDISFLVPTQNLHELNIQTSNIAILGVNTLEQAMATFPAQAATSSSHNSSPKATPNTQVVQVATAKTIRVTHWLIIFMLALLVGVAAFSFDFSLQTQSAALQQVKPNPIKQTTQRPNSLANSQATKVNYPLGLTANFSYANQNNCSQINKSAISQFLTVQNPVSQPHQNLCKISIVAAEQVASLMAVNLQSHLFVLGKKVKEHWAIPVPKRPAKVIVITFSLALSEDDVSQIRQYLFNYPDNQTLDIQGFIDSIQSNNKHLKNNILSHYSLQLTGS